MISFCFDVLAGTSERSGVRLHFLSHFRGGRDADADAAEDGVLYPADMQVPARCDAGTRKKRRCSERVTELCLKGRASILTGAGRMAIFDDKRRRREKSQRRLLFVDREF